MEGWTSVFCFMLALSAEDICEAGRLLKATLLADAQQHGAMLSGGVDSSTAVRQQQVPFDPHAS
jgi:hypothetical protein